MKPKTKEGGSAFGAAVEAGSNELKEAELRDAEAEFKNFMEGPDTDPESKAGIDKAIADLEKEIAEKCPTEYAQMEAGSGKAPAGKTKKGSSKN
jgi:hypothetical protein